MKGKTGGLPGWALFCKHNSSRWRVPPFPPWLEEPDLPQTTGKCFPLSFKISVLILRTCGRGYCWIQDKRLWGTEWRWECPNLLLPGCDAEGSRWRVAAMVKSFLSWVAAPIPALSMAFLRGSPRLGENLFFRNFFHQDQHWVPELGGQKREDARSWEPVFRPGHNRSN